MPEELSDDRETKTVIRPQRRARNRNLRDPIVARPIWEAQTEPDYSPNAFSRTAVTSTRFFEPPFQMLRRVKGLLDRAV